MTKFDSRRIFRQWLSFYLLLLNSINLFMLNLLYSNSPVFRWPNWWLPHYTIWLSSTFYNRHWFIFKKKDDIKGRNSIKRDRFEQFRENTYIGGIVGNNVSRCITKGKTGKTIISLFWTPLALHVFELYFKGLCLNLLEFVFWND